jgi:hypothetical protein
VNRCRQIASNGCKSRRPDGGAKPEQVRLEQIPAALPEWAAKLGERFAGRRIFAQKWLKSDWIQFNFPHFNPN